MNDRPPGHENEHAASERRVALGVIAAPQGLQGQVRMLCWTQFPERIPQLKQVYLDDEEQPRKLRAARLQGSLAILTLEGVSNRDEADQLRGVVVRIPFSEAAPLEEDEYYHFQLIGLNVYDEAGNHLGKVTEIIETGANDVYVVRDQSGREELFPALKEVVLDIDLDAGRMTVRPLTYES